MKLFSKEGAGRLSGIFSKARYPALILALGILLLAIPSKKTEKPVSEPIQEVPSGLSLDETRLEELLSQVKGAGQVRVLLSCETGQTTDYAADTDVQTQQEENSTGTRESSKTVLHSSGSGAQSALIVGTGAPTYRGALVVCQGADDPNVKLAIVQAVAGLTGLRTNQIVVMKMK